MTAKKAPPPDKDDPVKVSGILDEVSRGIIFQGVSVPQLRAIFNLKDEDVMRRLGDLSPVGTGRQNNPVYNLAQAAARIVRPRITPEAIDAYMRTANPANMPPMVSKHYWEGLRTRERYREEVDELWYTEDVMRLLSETFQTIRATLVLLPDAMRGREDMTEAQFRFVQRLVDDMIEDVRARLVDPVKPSRAEGRTGAWEEAGAV